MNGGFFLNFFHSLHFWEVGGEGEVYVVIGLGNAYW
jgi:hypothetical protein